MLVNGISAVNSAVVPQINRSLVAHLQALETELHIITVPILNTTHKLYDKFLKYSNSKMPPPNSVPPVAPDYKTEYATGKEG